MIDRVPRLPKNHIVEDAFRMAIARILPINS